MDDAQAIHRLINFLEDCETRAQRQRRTMWGALTINTTRVKRGTRYRQPYARSSPLTASDSK